MLNRADAKILVQKAVSATKYYAVAILNVTKQGTTRFANSEISQNITITDSRLSLCIYDGKKQVTCATNDMSDAGLTALAKNAEEMLAFVPEGEYDAFPFSTQEVPERIQSDELAKAFDTAGRALYVKNGVALLEAGYTASGALSQNKNVLAIGDTSGGFRYASYIDVAFNTVVSHSSGADGAAECVSYTTVPDIAGCFQKAMTTAKAALNPIQPDLGAFTVVLSPTAFGDLVSFAAMMLNAKQVDDGVSFAAGKLGQQVFGKNLTISDDANHPELIPLSFDMEGNPKKPLPLIENGVVKNYVYDNKRAKKHGVESTGHAIITRWYSGAMATNIVVEGGEKTIDEIIADTKNGIFINELHYTNFVNARMLQVTGLTRNGTFLIENGKLTKPIATVRFTESLLDAFSNITEVSKERELVSGFGAALMPGVKIEGFHFTSKA